MQDFLYIDKLSFSYENCVKPLFDSLSFQLQQGWTGIVGANGSGKTTLLKLSTGNLPPDFGFINFKGTSYYCEQRTDFIPSDFKNFISATDKYAFRLKNALQIQDDWLTRWDQLSHGERKRCQIATALFCDPALLAIDEPSNHLDTDSKQILFNALKAYKGIGILVSHDRELLDNLCRHTLFIEPTNVEVYKCNYSTAVQEKQRDHQANIHDYEMAKREVKKLKRKISQQRIKADKADKLRSKRNIHRKDHDAKSKKDLARLSGKDGVAGRIHKRMQTQLDRIMQRKDSIHTTKTFDLGIQFNQQEARRYFPIIMASNQVELGKDKHLSFHELTIQHCDKIGIIGDNGSGKSTFINYLRNLLSIPDDRLLYIPQEIPVEQSRSMIDRIQNFNNDEKGKIMTIIRRLGSEPVHVLETTIPSPGEIRKLMLAEGIMLNPALIIMDEPTNHMDLPSIECVESALNECNCTQLLVSHDHEFLKRVVHNYWAFIPDENNGFKIITKR